MLYIVYDKVIFPDAISDQLYITLYITAHLHQ